MMSCAWGTKVICSTQDESVICLIMHILYAHITRANPTVWKMHINKYAENDGIAHCTKNASFHINSQSLFDHIYIFISFI